MVALSDNEKKFHLWLEFKMNFVTALLRSESESFKGMDRHEKNKYISL